jgi:hypothetical protein
MIYLLFIFRLLLVAVFVVAVLNEKRLIKFEHKLYIYVKAFLKALYYTCKEVIQK